MSQLAVAAISGGEGDGNRNRLCASLVISRCLFPCVSLSIHDHLGIGIGLTALFATAKWL